MNSSLDSLQTVVDEIRQIILSGRETAYQATHAAMIRTYWSIGKRIVEQEQRGADRAEYGTGLIATLADELTREFGNGFSDRNLRNCRKFYQLFPDPEIWNACVPNLNWTHFRSLLRVPDENARLWYLREAAAEGWSSRTLDRNISTQYYYRLLQSPKKDRVITEMKENTASFQKHPFEMIKSPILAEFLGFRLEDSFAESVKRRAQPHSPPTQEMRLC